MTKERRSYRKVTINIDQDVFEYFRNIADVEERPYQPLMNKVLREYVAKQRDKSKESDKVL